MIAAKTAFMVYACTVNVMAITSGQETWVNIGMITKRRTHTTTTGSTGSTSGRRIGNHGTIIGGGMIGTPAVGRGGIAVAIEAGIAVTGGTGVADTCDSITEGAPRPGGRGGGGSHFARSKYVVNSQGSRFRSPLFK